MRLFSLLLLCFSSESWAEVTTDHQLWLGAGAKMEVIDDLDIEFTQHVRRVDNASRTESIMPELGVGYAVLSWFEVAASYRAISENDDEDTRLRGRRVAASGELEHGVGPVDLGTRLQWQQKHVESEASTKLRYRGQVGLDTSTFVSPLVAYELFVDPGAERGEQAQKSRVTAGAGMKMSKAHRLKFKYHHQLELDGDGDVERIFVLGYRFGFSLK